MKNINITLWVNENKTKDTQPDYTATIKIGDTFEDIGGGWRKVSEKSGKKFLSLSFKTEVLKQAITEIMKQTNSDGTQQPNFDRPATAEDF